MLELGHDALLDEELVVYLYVSDTGDVRFRMNVCVCVRVYVFVCV